MLKRAFIAAAGLAFTLVLSSYAVDAKELSGKISYVLTADLKAAKDSPLMKFISEQIDPDIREQAEAKLGKFQAECGIDIANEIEYFVQAGGGSLGTESLYYLYGKFDQQRLTNIWTGSDRYSAWQHEGVAAYSFFNEGDDTQKYISFARPGLVLVATGRDLIKEALDVLAGRQAGLSASSPLSKAVQRTPENIISIYASGISSIVGEVSKTDILRHAEGIALRIRASGEEVLNADLSLTADSVETAQQIQQTLLGVQALTMLQAAEKPETAALASQAKVTMDGQTVGITMSLPKSLIAKTMRLMMSSYKERDNQQ